MFEKITDFISEIFSGLDSGSLFFGGPWDIARYCFDIILITFLLYNLLRIIRETRAWQLLKGVILISLFALLCSILRLEMVSYAFNKLLYIIAIAFVVIFQPELRRALETVGLRSFASFSSSSPYGNDEHLRSEYAHMVDELSMACGKLASTYTGAIIIIERATKLGELLEQENVVRLDSSVTNSMLQSLFYKGSPLHDGAVLIRDGRIIAARCHVPLAETLHVLEQYGTRHRAAVGASEIGDTICVVVSEERGSISIAVGGELFLMKDADTLNKNLSYLLHLSDVSSVLKKKIRDARKARNREEKKPKNEAEIVKNEMTKSRVPDGVIVPSSSISDDVPITSLRLSKRTSKVKRSQRVVLLILSFVISLGLWMYIQINNNPVMEKMYEIPLTYENTTTLEDKNLEASYPVETVTVRIVGRKEVLDELLLTDLKATIDFSQVSEAGVARLPVTISSDENVYYRIEMQNPEVISVSIFEVTPTEE